MKSQLRSAVAVSVIALGAAAGLYAADATAGKAVYAAKCKTCHGADGAGNPAMFKVAKADLKSLSDASVQAKSDADLKNNITNGVGKMKAVPLAGADLDNVVAAVRTFKK